MKKKRLHYDVTKCVACRTCELVCFVGHSLSKDIFEAISEKKIHLPKVKVFQDKGKNFPVACRHCDDPKCVDACIARALTYDLEKKEVIHDKDKCVGCWMCIMVCPYGAIRPDKRVKIPTRCDHCVEIGQPQCAKNCPTKAISYEEEEGVK
ncbi:MAG: 4Fe-4S dicluster domain-containing protein [Candidatus Omnitrophica bacterium]|nr:4Fe-4S dicluster domain-containing protein [Candidatus Omnitrophota bacterium]